MSLDCLRLFARRKKASSFYQHSDLGRRPQVETMQRWSFMAMVDTPKKFMHLVRGAIVAEDLVA